MLSVVKMVLFVSAMLVPAKHALHIFQQNSYIVSRYLEWLKENALLRIKAAWLPVCAALIFRYPVPALVFLLMYGLYTEHKASYRKPLVYTARVKRQIAVEAVLVLILCAVLLKLRADAFLPALSLILPWLLVIPVGWITAPIERGVQQSFLNDAKRILAEQSGMIRIGITGSYGKTSTKNVIQAVLSEKYNSLMTPASFNTPMGITRTIREYMKPIHKVFVCEMGADKPGDISELMEFVHPTIGIVTSIGPQHLATFGSQEKITYEKMRMVEELPPEGTAILNYDNEIIRNYQIQNPVRVITYGIHCPEADYRAEDISYSENGSRFTIVHGDERVEITSPLLGELNILNILSAAACGRLLDVDWNAVRRGIRTMKPVEHRLERKTIGGRRFIDDAFNANPSGAHMALNVLSMMPGRRWIVTPGMIELGDRQEEINHDFGMQMKGQCDEVILVGPVQTRPVLEGLQDAGFDAEHIRTVDGIEEAMRIVFAETTAEDTILLENDLPDAFNH